MEKLRGPSPQLMDHGGTSPRWTLDRGLAMTSPELSLMAALGHGGLPAMAHWGSPPRASLGRGRWRGDQATVLKK
jgi:hypothetical protein